MARDAPRAVDIIRAKRDGAQLERARIEWFIDEYARGGAVSEEQAAAMAMAIFFRGMEGAELAAWTQAMIESGSRLDLGDLRRPTVDKHSTGGVGDKISLVLVPLVAACGGAVPQLSGRGLGHTGGTLDKLESIPGWRSDLTAEEIRSQLDVVGGVIASAGRDLAPADRKLYALRDVTATVDSIPLIASSIMSKKIAEGTASLVLDVKVGRGAFMTDREAARALALTMVELGEAHGVATTALLTRMDDVLGRAAGNALEVAEALEVLEGGGPPDVVELTVALAREMLDLAGIAADPAAVLRSGEARTTFERIVAAQGGDLSEGLPVAPERRVLGAERSGFVHRVDALTVGKVAWLLGAGRSQQDDPVSAVAGVVCQVTVGDDVVAGQPILELHGESGGRLDEVEALARSAVVIGQEQEERPAIVIDRVGPGDLGP